jgi:ABC-2 type transport system ATP-binding protein
MIEVRNLTKCYGDRKAIDTLNFSVKKGEVVGFLGLTEQVSPPL